MTTAETTAAYKLELFAPLPKLIWRRDGTGWRLFAGRRRFGRVVPDDARLGMFRSVLPTGRLSRMANLSWAKAAVLESAVREIEWEVHSIATTDPAICPENGGLFEAASPPIAPREGAATPIWAEAK